MCVRAVEGRCIMGDGKWAAWGKAWGQNHLTEQFNLRHFLTHCSRGSLLGGTGVVSGPAWGGHSHTSAAF